MCGVAGSIGQFDPSRVDAVKAMNDAQRHRGPDDDGLWSQQQGGNGHGATGVVLGHRRLSIIDLSPAGHQPMVDAESGCVICFNGEVYNHLELRKELEAEGVRFDSHCDTEVILKAYARRGEGVLARLRGMFAIALWDPKKGKLLLARDRLGIKPLYYTTVQAPGGGRACYFASEIRSLLATGHVARKIDPVGLSTYLWNGVVIGPHTLLRGVALLPAGTALWVGLDGEAGEPRAYWRLPASHPQTDPDVARAELARELEDAVRMRLLADVPLGVFLSGGIDSSAIAALATRVSSTPVKTCTITFDEARYDESGHARAVASALGTDHQEVRLTGDAFRGGLGDALSSLDQPTFDAINTYFVSKAVREAGLTVALAGTGGDELYGGYASFRDLPRAHKAAALSAPAPEALLRAGARLFARAKLGAPGAVAPQTRWGKLGDALATRGDLVDLYQVSYGLFTQEFLHELHADGAGGAVRYGLPRARHAEFERMLDGEPALHAISMLELSCFLGERLLRDTDTASMAVALEVRVPLIDHVVVERLAEVPEAARFAPLGRKQLLRDVALRGLDPKLFDRPKAGFELPLDVWCRQQLGADIDATLRDPELCGRAGLRAEAVARLWRAFQDRAPGLYWSRVWGLYVLLWWCRQHDVAL
jgi:asparagine synthase (glutamine-hydrolysing)